MSGREIHQCARVLLDKHGAHQSIRRAEERANQLLARGDRDGWAAWQHIKAAVVDQARNRRSGEAVN